MINLFRHTKHLTAALIIGCFFVSACENDVNEVRELGRKKIGVDEGKNIDSYLSVGGRMKAHLTSPLMLRYQSDTAAKTEFPKSLHVDFYNDSTKQIESQLRADYGEFLESQKKVYLRGNVVAFNVKGDTLFCQDMYWDQNTGRFYTDKRTIVSKGFRNALFICLEGMNSDQSFTDIHFFKMRPGSFFTAPDSTNADTTKPH
jgi:LPS export ABC transporter protein LptC